MISLNDNFSALHFDDFDLVVAVDLRQSVDATKQFIGRGIQDFLFAVGDIKVVGAKSDLILVIENESASNLLEFLTSFEKNLQNDFGVSDLSAILGERNWCDAANDYWKSLMADSATPKDERIFDTLTKAILLSGSEGEILLFKRNGKLLLEVCSAGQNIGEAKSRISEVNKTDHLRQIQEIIDRIQMELKNRLD